MAATTERKYIRPSSASRDLLRFPLGFEVGKLKIGLESRLPARNRSGEEENGKISGLSPDRTWTKPVLKRKKVEVYRN